MAWRKGELLWFRSSTPVQLRVSTDEGGKRKTSPILGYDLNVSVGDGDTLFMSGTNALAGASSFYRAGDGGRSCSTILCPLPGNNVWSAAQGRGVSIAMFSVPDSTGTFRLYPYLSRDGGESWNGVPGLGPDSTITSATPMSGAVVDSEATVFLRSTERGVFRLRRSDPGWRAASDGLPPTRRLCA